MKITEIVTSTVIVPNGPPVSAYYGANTYVVARIRTDEGLEGLGYTMLVGGMGAGAVRTYLEESIIPLILGRDPLRIGAIWRDMYENDRGLRKKGIPRLRHERHRYRPLGPVGKVCRPARLAPARRT